MHPARAPLLLVLHPPAPVLLVSWRGELSKVTLTTCPRGRFCPDTVTMVPAMSVEGVSDTLKLVPTVEVVTVPEDAGGVKSGRIT